MIFTSNLALLAQWHRNEGFDITGTIRETDILEDAQFGYHKADDV